MLLHCIGLLLLEVIRIPLLQDINRGIDFEEVLKGDV
jgi:hypothetical protein